MRLVVGLVLALVVASGCGSSTGNGSSLLEAPLERVDQAAVADDPEALESALAALLRAVDDAEAAGELDPARADEIRAAAEALLAAASPAPGDLKPAPDPEERSTPPPPPPGGEEDDDEDDAEDDAAPPPGTRGHGKAHGHDKPHEPGGPEGHTTDD